jgi:predicted nucleic acid-binding protein
VTGYLIDASVISAFAPDRPAVPADVRGWMIARSGSLHMATMTFLEIAQGARKLARAGASGRAEALTTWLDALAAQYGRRILGLDARLARVAGDLANAAIASGRHPGLADVVIAATAKGHSLTLLTRNLRHFEPLGVAAFDPFAAA